MIMDSLFRLSDGNDYGYDAIITFWCVTGYGFGDGSMYSTTNCLSNGQWSNEVDTCRGISYCHRYNHARFNIPQVIVFHSPSRRC